MHASAAVFVSGEARMQVRRATFTPDPRILQNLMDMGFQVLSWGVGTCHCSPI
jgi:hypothetical protein